MPVDEVVGAVLDVEGVVAARGGEGVEAGEGEGVDFAWGWLA